MHVAAREVRRVQKVSLGKFVIALLVGRRHAARVHPEEVNGFSIEARLGQVREQQLRSGTARDGEGGLRLAGESLVQQLQSLARARRRRLLSVLVNVSVDTHPTPRTSGSGSVWFWLSQAKACATLVAPPRNHLVA